MALLAGLGLLLAMKPSASAITPTRPKMDTAGVYKSRPQASPTLVDAEATPTSSNGVAARNLSKSGPRKVSTE